jgi:iron(II)-dependent oxidoreductase
MLTGFLVGCDQIAARDVNDINSTILPTATGTQIDIELDPNSEAAGQEIPIIQEFNGVEMVLVPPGCFLMGTEDSLAEEQPVHEICFEEPFWIDRTEVTVAQFAAFLNDQPEPVDNYDAWLHVWGINDNIHYQLTLEEQTWRPLFNLENQPLENATWIGAAEFCAWRDARLPTEAEWEYAARGPENNLYPWGNEFIPDNIVRFTGSNPDVGSKPQGASWVGALDMAGSVFEWTSSLYFPYPYDALDGREASFSADSVSHRVFRGCAWYHDYSMNDNLTAAGRFDAPPDFANWYYGFRCARTHD